MLVGGPPTITIMGALKVLGPFIRWFQHASKYAGKFEELSQKAMDKVSDKFGKKIGWLANKAICFLTGHPVDVASGQVLTEATDIELPGPLPFKFERIWYSASQHRGSLGHGWHHSYDLSLTEFAEGIVVRLADGRGAIFPTPELGLSEFNRQEKLFLHRTAAGYDLEDLNGRVHHFGWAGQKEVERPLEHVRDPNGNRISLVREYGKLVAFVDSGGRRLPVVTDAEGRITEIHGPDPEKHDETFALVSYRYSREGDLVEVRDALGNPFRYEYANHLLMRETDRVGLSFYFKYDSDNYQARCIRTWGDGNVFLRELAYDLDRQRTEVINSLGHKTVYNWNDLGVVTQLTDPLGGITKTEWSRFGEKLAEVNPASGTTAFEYDPFGRLLSIVDPLGSSAAYQYDSAGNVIVFTAPDGHVWKREYDSRRNIVSITDPLGNRRTFEADIRGLPVKAIDPLGQEAHFGWTAAGELAWLIDRVGARFTFEYDRLGRQTARIDALGGTTREVCDRRGSVGSFIDQLGRTTHLKFNPADNLSEITDPLGRKRTFKYGVMGRIAEVRKASGRVTRYRYDLEGRLIEARDPANNLWRFVRDPLGNVIEEKTYDGRVLSYRYNSAGHLIESRNARGQTITFIRDKVGRTIKRILPDGIEETFKYNSAGLLTDAKNADANVKWGYDPCFRVLEENLNGKAVKNVYDGAGNRVKRVSPFGRELQFDHDGQGRLVAVAEGSNPLFQSKLDLLGREKVRTSSGAIWNWDYALTGETTAVTVRGQNTYDRRYSYNAAGERTGQVDSTFGAAEYSLDVDGYLTAVRYADGRGQEYTYDEAGNIRQPSGMELRRDADGEMIAKATNDARWKYSYDALGQLKRAATDNGMEVSFTYDPLGRRVKKTAGSSVTEFFWDGDVTLGEVSDKTKEYLFRPGTFEPMAILGSEGAALLDCDPIGLPQLALNPDGALAWQAEFEPFGEVRAERGRAGLVNIRYPGQYADSETGLFYNRFRYYDPQQRAYTRPDPLGLMGSGGIWDYVPNPLTWIDPYGLNDCKAGEKPLYRGGASVEPRKGIDYKVGPDGLVNERGISLNADKLDKNIQKYGGAFELDAGSVPAGLKIKPTSGSHYEIVPARPMTEAEYLNLMKQVQLKPYNQL